MPNNRNAKNDPDYPGNPEPTVLLLNRALPYNCIGKLSGWSGVEYGTSTFEEGPGAHVCRLPLARWREVKGDVTRGMARLASQWEVDIEWPPARAGVGAERRDDVEPPAREAAQAPPPGTAPRTMSRAATLAAALGDRPREARPVPHHAAPTAASLAAITSYQALLKLAREAGLDDPGQYDSAAQMRAAILAHQEAPGGDGAR